MVKVRICANCKYVLKGDEDLCPGCDANLKEIGVEVDEIYTCPDCGEVIESSPCKKCGRTFATARPRDSQDLLTS